MDLEVLKERFSICKLEDLSLVDFNSEYVFLCKTNEENSLVCECNKVPLNATKNDEGWRAFRVSGVLDFSIIGILSEISGILAENKIGIFAVSTYNTDYVFVKEYNFKKALTALEKSGYNII